MAAVAKFTFKQFQAEYPDDAACLDKIMLMTYGGTHIHCEGCHRKSKFHRIEKRRAYACQHCGHHIYPCVGTVFEKSRTPLNKWFFAMYLFTSTRHGVAARELERQLGVTYKCAWRIAHELRKLMANADEKGPLSGVVEVDETYIGGRRRRSQYKTGSPFDNKTAILGMVERDGNVRALPVENLKADTVLPIVNENVAREARVMTDDASHYYQRLGHFAEHGVINHNGKKYVRGDVHTNTIEGYWSRLKNSIKGTHIHISEKHALKYVCEFAFRYNMRKRPAAMFDRLIASV